MTVERTTDGTPAIPRHALVAIAVRRFRTRFPEKDDAIGQRMRLLLHLLDRVAEHAKVHGVAAVFAGQAGMDAFAFDCWAEYIEHHAGGQQNQPVQESLPRLVSYWNRELARGGTGREASTFVRDSSLRIQQLPDGFTITEEFLHPFAKGQLERVQFRIRQAKDRLAAVALGPDEEREGEERQESQPKPDARLVLSARAAMRQLYDNAQALVTAFKESERPAFHYTDRGTTIDVVSASDARGGKPRGRRAAQIAAACFIALVALGGLGRCAAGGYSRAVVAGVERFSLINKIGANASCDPATGKLAMVVNWGPAITPSSIFTNAQLVRNGRVIATVDGRSEYWDMHVDRGKYYQYTLQLADVFGNILVRDMAAGSDDAVCPGDPRPSYVTLTPTEGTFATPFTAIARPPADEGQPVSFAWQVKADRLNPQGGLTTTPLPVTRAPSRTIHFSPCTCGQLKRGASGTYRWMCEAQVYVTFVDGRVVSYNSLPVMITEPVDHACIDEDLRRSDAQ